MNKEVKKRLDELKKELEELQATINKPDRWQDGLVQPGEEKYFYLTNNSRNGLRTTWGAENNRKPEHAFKTEEEAKLIKEKTLLMWEMYNFAYVRNEGWMPNWHDEREEKFGIISNKNKAYVEYFFQQNQLAFGVAVKSMEIAEEMLEIFGERIEKFYNKMY